MFAHHGANAHNALPFAHSKLFHLHCTKQQNRCHPFFVTHSAAVEPVLKHVAKMLGVGASKASRWPEQKTLKMLNAIEAAGWDTQSSKEIVSARILRELCL